MRLLAPFARTHLNLLRLSLFVCLLLLPQFASATTIYLTSGSSWTVPSDWNSSNNTIELYGGGGGGGGGYADGDYTGSGGGGGGGGYSRLSDVALTPGASIPYAVGGGGAGGAGGGIYNPPGGLGSTPGDNGGDTYFNGWSAGGGQGGNSCYAGGGGSGNVANGGSGGSGDCGGGGGAGGGGAAGPSGGGGAGGSADTGGGGGGGGGGYAGAGGSGQSLDQYGNVPGTSVSDSGVAGNPAPSGGSYGGGGGGGSATADFVNVGGGGNGAPGLIIITYTPSAPTPTCQVTLSPNPSAYASSGSPVTLTWSSGNASQVYINNIGWVGTSGSTNVASQSSTDYSCYGYSSAYGPGSWNSASLTVTPVATLSPSTQSIVTGNPASFTYAVNGNISTSTTYSVDGGPSLVSINGSLDFMLSGNIYDLFASSSLPTTYLTPIGSSYYLDTNGSGPELQYQGSPVVLSEFGAWVPIAAQQVSGGYQVAWYHPVANEYTVWSTDSSGNYITNIVGSVSLSTFESDAPQFDAYINNSLKYSGTPVVLSEFGAWVPIAAQQVSGGYQVAWYYPPTNVYTAWSTDSSGNYITNIVGSVSLSTFESDAPQFDAYVNDAFPVTGLPIGSHTIVMTTANALQFNPSNAATVTVKSNNPPSCTLSASPSSITQGGSSTLSWSCTNATSCTGTNFSTGGSTSGSTSVSPTQTTTYTGSCTGPGGTSNFSGNGQVAVTCTQSWSCSGQTIVQTNTNCSTTNLATCTSPAFCQSGANQCLYPAISFTPSGSYSGQLQLIPNLVSPGESTQVHWSVANAEGCTVTGTNGDSWTGLISPTNGKTSRPITAQTTYTLSCAAYGSNPPVNESKTVNVVPVYKEL